MTSLADLKFSPLDRPPHRDPIVVRRSKFMEKLQEQVDLVDRLINGHPSTSHVSTDDSHGETRSNQRKTACWWWKEKTGKFFVFFKYGSKTLELSKGKPSIQCDSLSDIKKAFETVHAATDRGELDQLLIATGKELRGRFKTR